MYHANVTIPAPILSEGRYPNDTLTVDVNTDGADYGERPYLVTVGSGFNRHDFLVFARAEDDALARALDCAVETAPGWTTAADDPDLIEALENEDEEGYATDDGSVYLGHFDALHIRKLDGAAIRAALAAAGVKLGDADDGAAE
jgi:hypothetical protein